MSGTVSSTSTRRAALLRYAAFQLPEWLLVLLLLLGIHHYTETPGWVLWLGGTGFVVKDLLLFPWMRRAYEKTANDPGEHLVGRAGTVVEALSPEGWVRVNAELWRARSERGVIPAGSTVQVRALRGHWLLVEPD